MADLKPCPFHGKHPDNCRCLLVLLPHSFNDSVSRWDCRPLEDAKDATIERMRGLLGEVRDPVGRSIQYERTFASKETPTIREFRHILARIEAELEGDGDG